MKTSDSFEVVITDKDAHEINYVERAMTITMKQGKDVGPVTIKMGSETVGS